MSEEKQSAPETDPEENGTSPQPSPEPSTQSEEASDSEKQSKISRYVSFGLLVAIIIVLSILFYEVMASFLVPLFLSALLVVVFRPVHKWIHEKVKGRDRLAAGLTTAVVLLAVLVPIGILFAMAAAEGREALRQFNATQIVQGVRQLRTNLKLDMPSAYSLRLIEAEFADLQDNPRMDEETENQQQISLFDIEDAAKQLAFEKKLSWPERDEELEGDVDPSWNSRTNWEKFVLKLADTRALHANMNWSPGESDAEKRSSRESLNNYQSHINETAGYFAAFKTELLGGKTRALLTELANPTDSDSEAYVKSIVTYMREKLFVIGGKGVSYVGSLLFGTVIMVIGLYFFLLDGPKMIESFKGLSPIDDEHEQELVTEFGRVSRAVVVATLLSALVQGLLAGLGFYVAGLESVFLLTAVTTVLAMVPFVGAASVWIPCALYLYFFDNNLVAAIGLAIYGATVISMADNIIKPYILHGQSNLHPLLALLSVIGGVSVLGPIGILIGPMVVAFLQTLLKILQREMQEMDVMTETYETS